MSIYYKPEEVKANGRTLKGGGYNRMSLEVRHTGERIVMLGDRGIFKVAVDVTEQSEYEYHHSTEQLMSFIRYDYYAYYPPSDEG